MEVDTAPHVDDEIKVEEIDKNVKPSQSGEVLFPFENKYVHIKNKQVRLQGYQKQKRELRKVGYIVYSILY